MQTREREGGRLFRGSLPTKGNTSTAVRKEKKMQNEAEVEKSVEVMFLVLQQKADERGWTALWTAL